MIRYDIMTNGYKKHLAAMAMMLFVFLVIVLETFTSAAFAAGVPGIKAKKSEKNILRLMRRYDKDAYYILKKGKTYGHRFTIWMRGGKRIVDKIDTCVHETNHTYIFSAAPYNSTGCFSFYEGKGKTREVPQGEYMKTEKATSKIPRRLRTLRYNVYASKGSGTTANVMGHVGLLNEFSSYYWGMHAMYSLYPYMKKNVKSSNGWVPFIMSYVDEREAYAEFYYWTLTYLRYLKKHDKKLYKSVMGNTAYLRAFTNTEKAYRKLIKKYRKAVNAVSRKYNHRSFNRSVRNGSFRMGSYYYPVRKGYSKLKKELASSKFKAVKKDIKKYLKKGAKKSTGKKELKVIVRTNAA